jgi:hypothetical protein
MLGNDDLGRALLGRLRVVGVVPVDEAHDVRVLFDPTAFSQVGEHGALVLAVLQGAVELGEGHDRGVQVAGQDLEAPGELGHLHLAVLRPLGGAHELEVVDHHQAQVAVAGLEAAALGPHLHDGEVGVVVDEEGGLGQAADGVADPVPVGLGDPSRAQVPAVHPRL